MAGLISWFITHPSIWASLGTAILDFVFTLNPNTESNGIIHWIYNFFTSKKDA